MKKLALTIAIVLGIGLTSFADPNGGGVFQRGDETSGSNSSEYFSKPALPRHGQTSNQNAPLGTGIAVLTALGAAYLVGKRRKED
jgi:hypothetical protein